MVVWSLSLNAINFLFTFDIPLYRVFIKTDHSISFSVILQLVILFPKQLQVQALQEQQRARQKVILPPPPSFFPIKMHCESLSVYANANALKQVNAWEIKYILKKPCFDKKNIRVCSCTK